MRLLPLPINRSLALPLVPWFIRCRFSANAITGLSLVSGIIAGVLLARGTVLGMVCGAFAFLMANLLDECDGKVARETNACSPLGALLDTVTDCIVHAAFFLGLGIGVAHQAPQGPWLLLGNVAVGGSILSCALDVGGITPWHPPGPSSQSPEDSLAWLAEWFRVDFSILVLISAAFHQMAWILWAGALGVFLFWLPSAFWIAVRERR